MFPYYVMVFIPLFLSVIDIVLDEKIVLKKRQNKIILISFFSIFLLLLFLRDISVGIDLENYRSIFESINSISLRENIYDENRVEIGYIVLNKLIGFRNGNFRTLLICVAVISVIPIAVFYVKESEMSILTMFLFLCVAPFSMYFSGLRQAIAMAFSIPAYYFVKHKKPLLFLLMVVLAFLFHHSALILLLLYPVYHIKINRFLLSILSVILIVVFIFRSQVFDFLTNLLGETYADRYGYSTDTGAFTSLILYILFTIFSYLIVDENECDKDFLGLRNILVLIVFLQVFASINTVAMRLNYYFLLFIPIIIPKAINRAHKDNIVVANVAHIILMLFFGFYFFYNAYTGADILQIYHYIPFWRG